VEAAMAFPESRSTGRPSTRAAASRGGVATDRPIVAPGCWTTTGAPTNSKSLAEFCAVRAAEIKSCNPAVSRSVTSDRYEAETPAPPLHVGGHMRDR
jgi:hypothetical protein